MVGVSFYAKQDLPYGFYTAGRLGLSNISSKVERAIRTAIAITFERGNMEELSKYFDAKYFDSDKKPKNSEFIANIAEKVKFEIE